MHAFFSFGVTCVFLKWLSWFGQPMQSMHRNALQYQKCMRKEYVATTRFDYNFITLSPNSSISKSEKDPTVLMGVGEMAFSSSEAKEDFSLLQTVSLPLTFTTLSSDKRF